MVDGGATVSAKKEILDLLTEFLINAEVTNAYTLDEFKETFPPTVRNHNDVKMLYQSFQIKRKKLRNIVKKNLSLRFSTACKTQQYGLSMDQVTQDKPSGDDDTKHLKETLKTMSSRLKVVEIELIRCGKLFKDKDVLQHLQEKHFNI